MGGDKACVRGMRVTVGMVVAQVGAGHTFEEILADYPYLEREDIMQALPHFIEWASPFGPYYMMITGQARALGLILVANNVKEYARAPGLVLEDWSQA